MSLLEIFLIGVGLSMDAFAVAVCKGLAMPAVRLRSTLLIAAYFGVFQALMPAIGWFLGSQFAQYVTKFAPWIAFVLLTVIGSNMIRESFQKEEGEDEKKDGAPLRHRELLLLAIATSIDALAVGVTFSFVELAVTLLSAVLLIGVTTFCLSLAGVFIGNAFGVRYKAKAELAGGAILVLIGVKILLEYLLGGAG